MRLARIAPRVRCVTALFPALLLIILADFAAPAHAAGESGDEIAFSVASGFMKEGRFKEAREIFLILEHRFPDGRAIQIMLAQADVALKNFDAASGRLETLAGRHPDWPRPRIELARAHGAAGQVRKAKAILIAELGKDPPRPVRRNIERVIRRLEDSQGFVWRFSAGIVPDSNITGGSSADKVEFLGGDFILNDDAKAQSGVRGDISIGGTARTKWRDDMRLEASIDAAYSQPLGAEGVPSSNVRVGVAARFRGPDGSLALGFAMQPFFFDNDMIRAEHSLYARPVRRIAGRHYAVGSLTLTDGQVLNSTARDFKQWEATAGPSLGFGETGRLRLSGTFGHRNAGDDVFSFLRRGVSMKVGAAPWNGWRLDLNGAVTRDVYEDFNFPFGRRQKDLTTEAGVSVTRTGWVLFGLSPRLGLRWRRTRSTIDLYDRDSIAVTAGLTLPY